MLPKPYYHDEEYGITIYNADCREILPYLPKVDLVLTDPPYGMSYTSNWAPSHLQKGGIVNDTEFPLWIFDSVEYDVGMFLFCRWDNLPNLPTPKSFIVWDKGVHSMGDLEHEFGRQWEGIAFYPGANHAFVNRPVDVIRAMRVSPTNMVHPTEKPMECLIPLIRSHPANTILDPFMGSGTTLVAAKNLGRKCIGIEIEEKYCAIAVERLAQGNLFGGTQ